MSIRHQRRHVLSKVILIKHDAYTGFHLSVNPLPKEAAVIVKTVYVTYCWMTLVSAYASSGKPVQQRRTHLVGTLNGAAVTHGWWPVTHGP
jgi:hypothetical protein